MSNTDTKNHQTTEGYDLIGKVAMETQLPTDEMISFLVNIIKMDNVEPATLNLDELRGVVLNYLDKLN